MKLMYKGFLILWASAIMWFYLGNLVNFHQNRIWGKYLIPSCFTHSSVNKQDFGSLQNDDHDIFFNIEDLGFDQAVCSTYTLQPAPVEFHINYTYQDLFTTLNSGPVISANRLRGPPAA